MLLETFGICPFVVCFAEDGRCASDAGCVTDRLCADQGSYTADLFCFAAKSIWPALSPRASPRAFCSLGGGWARAFFSNKRENQDPFFPGPLAALWSWAFRDLRDALPSVFWEEFGGFKALERLGGFCGVSAAPGLECLRRSLLRNPKPLFFGRLLAPSRGYGLNGGCLCLEANWREAFGGGL